MKVQAAIVGGGPGGYVTAIRLRQKGISTLLFEKERLGGECLNWGCIPTKALVKISDLFNEIKHADLFGIQVAHPDYDYQKIAARKDDVVEKLINGLDFICKKREVTLVKEEVSSIVRQNDSFVIKTNESSYEADYVILATGSVPQELPGLKFDGKSFLSSRHILSLHELPRHLTIIGGGTIGCEFASIFNHLQVETEIVELLPNLLNNEDREIAKKLTLSFKKRGIKIHLNSKVTGYSYEDERIRLQLDSNKTVLTDKVLISTGRRPNCSIMFDNCLIDKDRERILINDEMETTEKNIFAIGDVTGKLMLAHTASKQGLIVAETIEKRVKDIPIDKKEKLHYYNIPRCTFTDPEVSSVGLTEAEALEKGIDIKTGKFIYQANGKAVGLGAVDGLIKVIADKKSNQLLGMHIIGAQATELIAVGSIMVSLNLTTEELQKVVYAHPTLSEIVMEAIEDLDGLAIHKI